MTFLAQAISTIAITELRATMRSSWQSMNRVPARYHFARASHPAVRYRRTLVNAGITLHEVETVVRRTRHSWRTNRA